MDELNMTFHDENYGIVDLQEVTIQALEQKHAHERNIFIEMLQGQDSLSVRSTIRKMSTEERQNQYTLLKMKRRKWRESSDEERIAGKKQVQYITSGFLSTIAAIVA